MVSLFELTMTQIIRIFLGLILAINSYAWNAIGHQLVAQIAYDHLTPQAQIMCHKYIRSSKKRSPESSFIAAASWLDYIRTKDIHWYDSLHYIDIPFSTDGTNLPPIQDINAVWGIQQALIVLASKKATKADKGLSLRVLIHLVGDIHQPLHSVTQVSNQLPQGDLGGNLFPLGTNNVGDNLHRYWDKGAGVLSHITQKQIKIKAQNLEKIWTCTRVSAQEIPIEWAKSSHQLALKQAYTINPQEIPSKKYQLNAQNISQQQIVLAGCRLATLINDLAN